MVDMHLMPALGRLGQAHACEFQSSYAYAVRLSEEKNIDKVVESKDSKKHSVQK